MPQESTKITLVITAPMRILHVIEITPEVRERLLDNSYSTIQYKENIYMLNATDSQGYTVVAFVAEFPNQNFKL